MNHTNAALQSVIVGSLLAFSAQSSSGGGQVTDCTEAALRAAMAGGGTVTFACDGTITLANTITNSVSAVLDGTGRQVTISGGNAVRVFYVNTNVAFTAVNLTIADGASANGAGIFNAGGVLQVVGTTFRSNAASFRLENGQPTPGEGGAIYNQAGTVCAMNCSFTGNRALQLTNCDECYGGSAGGAINNRAGQLDLANCAFMDNQVSGAAGVSSYPYPPPPHMVPPSTVGRGGAILNGGTLNASFCTFLRNSARGGDGGRPGPPCDYACLNPGIGGGGGNEGLGGAIYSYGSMVVTASAFLENTATGGTGGIGGPGPAWSWGIEGGMGGGGGFGRGGAFYNSGPAKLVNCTVASNLCIGGPGGMGGIGGSALSSDAYGGRGGRGGGGGSGNGSLYDTSGGLTMINCTLALNQGIAGSGGAGGAGGYGGRNGGNGAPGSPGPSGGAIGGLTAGGIGSTVWNTILASNSPGGNSSGAIRDTGHNLSSDASCNFTNVGSLNNTDPKLGPLTTNGGPTVTMALLPGSLAIDAGDNSGAPTTDQRGFPRPVGPAVDIGAYERCYVPVLAISPSATGLDITARSDVGQSCRLLSSTNMSHWFPIGTNQLGENGTVVFHDNCGSGAACRFYRLVMP